MKFFRTFIFCLLSIGCSAGAETLGGVKVENLYVQSLHGELNSEAHAVRINVPIDPSCFDRLYIDPLDKELISTLMAYKISGSTFNLHYKTGAIKKVVVGHLESTCKLFSIW